MKSAEQNDNRRRATNGAAAIRQVPDWHLLNAEEAVTDTLANIEHYCTAEGLDFTNLADRGHLAFIDETGAGY